MQDTKHALARNLTRLRSERHETQADLAHALGVSPAAISEWEQARKMPRADTLDGLAAHYGTTRAALISDPDALPPDLVDVLLDAPILTFGGKLLTIGERRLIERLARAVIGEVRP